MNASIVGQYPLRAISTVKPTQSTVETIRNGIRRAARSVIAPSSGETTKMIPIERAVMTPYTPSARSAPTCSRTQSEK